MTISIQSSDRATPQPAVAPTSAQAGAVAATSAAATDKAKDAPRAETRLATTADIQQKRQELTEAVSRINEQMRKQAQDLDFSIDEKANRFVITVKNSQTGEVVRQIPDESVLRVAHSMSDFKGLFHNGES